MWERTSWCMGIDNYFLCRALRTSGDSEKSQPEHDAGGETRQSHKSSLFWNCSAQNFQGRMSSFASAPLAESGAIQMLTFAVSTTNSLRSSQIAKASGAR